MLADLHGKVRLFSAVDRDDAVELTGADGAYLRALELQQLDVYGDIWELP